MKEIQSKTNSFIKELIKLKTSKGRKQQERFLVEGIHLVEEALKSGANVEAILFEDALQTNHLLNQYKGALYLISNEVVRALAETEQTQGIFAVVTQTSKDKQSLDGKKYLLLDAVQDPGNLGTLIRTADASGFDGVICGVGTVDPYNAKVLRSGQGSHFHLDIALADLSELIPILKSKHFSIIGTALNSQATEPKKSTIIKEEKLAIVLGNEGNGVSETILNSVDEVVYIPILGQAESLNVAVAGAILMYWPILN